MRTNRPGQSALLLLDVIEVLKREKVDYLVIGAFALSAHGVVRASLDVDALIQVSRPTLNRLRSLFSSAGFAATLRRGDAGDPIPVMLALADAHGNQVDLLGGLKGLDPEAFSRAMEVSFLGENLRITVLEDFIAMKCFAGGPQDLLDARSAYHSATRAVDLDLLRRLTRRFGRDAADHLEQVLAS